MTNSGKAAMLATSPMPWDIAFATSSRGVTRLLMPDCKERFVPPGRPGTPYFWPMSMREKLDLLDKRRAEAELGGGAARLKAQHAKGKLSARERLDLLLDEGSFVELCRFVVHRSIYLVSVLS